MNFDPFRLKEDEENWDRDRDQEWDRIKDEVDMDRGEWEYQKNVQDYGLTEEDMDSGDQEE
ncbi:hypothetical protein [Peribacillus sp. SCS-155]|uniref:hypothetical protein n=1 Tax=Peribacillus sedimenti TaxID=3115297 RepID=UPI003905A3FC